MSIPFVDFDPSDWEWAGPVRPATPIPEQPGTYAHT